MGADLHKKRLLIEHEWYPFILQKEIEIPQEGIHYILSDPHGYRHLLKKAYYLNYNLKIGETIRCRIDKINCSGKIYLEPEHPFYKEHTAYDFQFIERKTILNAFDEHEEILILADLFGNQLSVAAKNAVIVDNKVNCIVEQIKKGVVFVTPSSETKSIKGLKEGDWFFATIKKRITNHENLDFFVLANKSNQIFHLPTQYYENYKLNIGDSIYCKVVKIRSQWDYLLEPKNPYYIEGQSYDFRIEDKVVEENYQETLICLFITRDIFGIESKVEADPDTYQVKSIGDTIRCKVERIKKSKLLLSIED